GRVGNRLDRHGFHGPCPRPGLSQCQCGVRTAIEAAPGGAGGCRHTRAESCATAWGFERAYGDWQQL
ncbi:Myo-inositol 2-dehydrogenase (EC 1.1.1.18), partial [Pseudomonas sp. FEN]